MRHGTNCKNPDIYYLLCNFKYSRCQIMQNIIRVF